MLYRDITQVSVVGLRGTMYIEKTRDADGVSVQATGPYEAKAAGDSSLVICPEDYEPATPVPAAGAEAPVTVEGTQVGSVDVTARVHSAARPVPRRRARASARQGDGPDHCPAGHRCRTHPLPRRAQRPRRLAVHGPPVPVRHPVTANQPCQA